MYTFIHSVGYIISLRTYKIVISSNIPKSQCRYLMNNSPNILTSTCVTVKEPNLPAGLLGDWGRAETLLKDIIEVSSHMYACLIIVLFHIFMKLHCPSCTTQYHKVSDKFSTILVFAMLIIQSFTAYFIFR
jgi:hypothetical protein